MSDMLNAIIDQSFQDQRGRYYFLFDCAEYGDKLKVLKFSLEEFVSKPFKLKLQLTTRKKVDPRKLNDRFARLTIIDKHQPEKRHYCGIVSKAVQKDKGFDDGFTRFNVTIRPELHFAKLIYDNRIYQEQTIPQIVEQVLKESGVTRYRFHLLEPHEQRQYVVQYKRSNLQFIERLLASEGISYRFDHHEDGVELVMFDRSIEAGWCENAKELEYNSTSGSEVRGQSIKRFAWAESVRTNVATYREQHFKNPEAMYEQKWGSNAGNGQQRVLEKYSFPGYYKSDAAGERAARYESDSLLADASEGSGMGHAQFLCAGRKFKMNGHDEKRYNEHYFLVSVSQEGRQPNVEEEFASDEDSTFLKTKFTCVRDVTPWRPKRPETQQTDGDHLATVVGPENEEIHCDEFGRIKISYHWDRKGKKDDSASCWVRVSQNWAGSQYGGIMIPRVGQSVVVSYINGDVEQPLVTGRVFNSVEQVPYKLPDNKTKTTIRSQTHKGSGYNELSMDDTALDEEFFVRAQKNMNIHVLDNRSKIVNSCQTETIGFTKTIMVGSHHTETIGGNMLTSVALNMQQNVGATNNLNVGMDMTTTVGHDLKEHIGKDKETAVGGKYHVEVAKNLSFIAGTDNGNVQAGTTGEVALRLVAQSGAMRLVSQKGTLNIESQGNSANLAALQNVNVSSTGGWVMLTASKGIILNSGGSYLKITPEGIEHGTEAGFTVHAASHSFEGPKSEISSPVQFSGQYRLVNKDTGEPLSNTEYAIIRADGTVEKGTTDGGGQTHRLSATAFAEDIQIYIGDGEDDDDSA